MISTFAGSSKSYGGDRGPALQAELANPSALTGDLDGNIYVLDAANGRIRNIGSDGVITTVAGNADWGTGGAGFSDEGGKPDQANSTTLPA